VITSLLSERLRNPEWAIFILKIIIVPAFPKHFVTFCSSLPDAAPRLESPRDAFLLNNKELYHAVVTPHIPISSEVESGRRTIYQERLNRS
jgi:hypothetical protein